MGFTYTYDPERNYLHEKSEGEVSFQDILEYRQRLFQEVQLQPNYRSLGDYRDGVPKLTTEELRLLVHGVEQAIEVFGRLKYAIVATDPLIYGLTRMYQAFLEVSDIDVKVFKDIDEAEEWLLS